MCLLAMRARSCSVFGWSYKSKGGQFIQCVVAVEGRKVDTVAAVVVLNMAVVAITPTAS